MVAAQDPPTPDFVAEFKKIQASNAPGIDMANALHAFVNPQNLVCVANVRKYFDDNKINTYESQRFVRIAENRMQKASDAVTDVANDATKKEQTAIDAGKAYSDVCTGLLAEAKQKFPPQK